MLGKHHDLWTGDWKDPDRELAKMLGIRYEDLPRTLTEFETVPAEVVRDVLGSDTIDDDDDKEPS